MKLTNVNNSGTIHNFTYSFIWGFVSCDSRVYWGILFTAAQDYRLSYFFAGLTTVSPNTAAPVRGTYQLCGQYAKATSLSERCVVNCPADVSEARFVIIQQPATGQYAYGYLNFAEVEVYVNHTQKSRHSIYCLFHIYYSCWRHNRMLTFRQFRRHTFFLSRVVFVGGRWIAPYR